MKEKPRLQRRSQTDIGDAIAVRQLPRGATDGGTSLEMRVSVCSAGRVEPFKPLEPGDPQGCVCFAGTRFCLSPGSPHHTPIPPFWGGNV